MGPLIVLHLLCPIGESIGRSVTINKITGRIQCVYFRGRSKSHHYNQYYVPFESTPFKITRSCDGSSGPGFLKKVKANLSNINKIKMFDC